MSYAPYVINNLLVYLNEFLFPILKYMKLILLAPKCRQELGVEIGFRHTANYYNTCENVDWKLSFVNLKLRTLFSTRNIPSGKFFLFWFWLLRKYGKQVQSSETLFNAILSGILLAIETNSNMEN